MTTRSAAGPRLGVDAANLQEASTERASLDEAELHDLERAEYYEDSATVTTPEAVPAVPRRGLIDRLFRRGPA